MKWKRENKKNEEECERKWKEMRWESKKRK